MLDLNKIAVDPDTLEKGCWWKVWSDPVDVIAGSPCKIKDDEKMAGLLIVPAGYKFERAMEEERRPILDKLRDKTITEEEVNQATAKAIAKTVLRGWRNISVDGKPIEWSEQKCAELLSLQRWAYFRDFVLKAASYRAAALAAEEEKAAGN